MSGPFALDEARAQAWLAEASDMAEERSGEPAGDCVLHLTDTWQPADAGEADAISDMIYAANHNGVITHPPGITVGFEIIRYPDDPPMWRWLLIIDRACFGLAGLLGDLRDLGAGPGPGGLEQAMAVLRQAVEGANQILGWHRPWATVLVSGGKC